MVGEAAQKSDSDLPFDLGDFVEFVAFETDTHDNQLLKRHNIPSLTEDTLITFDFFTTGDTIEVTVIDSVMGIGWIPCYYNFFYQGTNDNINSYPSARFAIVNTQSELDSLFTCNSSLVLSAVDFSHQSLVLIVGSTSTSISEDAVFSVVKNCSGIYEIRMDIYEGVFQVVTKFGWIIIVNEVIQSKKQVNLMVNLLKW